MISSLGDRHPIIQGSRHFVAANATIIGSVTLKEGASVWFNAVIRGDRERIEIGVNSNIQDGAVLHADAGIPLQVGNNVTVGHQAMLHGCTIGDNSMIGIGATILNRARIGSNSIVGARALVTMDREFPEGVLILGSPARVERELRTDEMDRLKRSVDAYLEMARLYTRELGTDS